MPIRALSPRRLANSITAAAVSASEPPKWSRLTLRSAASRASRSDAAGLNYMLTLVDGLKPAEIAAQLGLNGEVVRARKSRALQKVIEYVRGLSRT